MDDERKLSPKTLAEQAAGRRAVAQRANAGATPTEAVTEVEAPKKPSTVASAPKSSKKNS